MQNRRRLIFTNFVAAMLVSGIAFGQVSQRTQGPKESCDSVRRGEHLPNLSDFSASRSRTSKVMPPILSTPLDKKFRTVIRDSVAQGSNFAGHYNVAIWGCGTGCAQFVIADVNTGRVFDPGIREVDYHYPSADNEPEWQCYSESLTYRVDSRLLIVEGCLAGKDCGRSYFVMASAGLRRIRYDPDLSKDGARAPF